MAPSSSIGRGCAPLLALLAYFTESASWHPAGDALCVATSDSNQAIGIGRVFRTRAESEGTQIYFDGNAPIQPGRSLMEFGIELPVDRQILRLEWPKFEQVLKATLDVPFELFPAFNGKKPHEQSYIRELLQLATIDDLLGPACGPEEEIVGMSVRDRYLVGKLSPHT